MEHRITPEQFDLDVFVFVGYLFDLDVFVFVYYFCVVAVGGGDSPHIFYAIYPNPISAYFGLPGRIDEPGAHESECRGS